MQKYTKNSHIPSTHMPLQNHSITIEIRKLIQTYKLRPRLISTIFLIIYFLENCHL